jgi:hypothetical protein
MSLVATMENNGTKFPPIEAGTYLARSYGLIDLGVQHSEAYDKDQHKILIMWELPTETFETDKGTETRVLSKQYTCSLSENANLRKDLEAWRGRKFTEDELRGFDLRKVIGVPCQLSVVPTEKNGKTYTNIGAVVSIPKGTTVPDAVHEKIIFDLDEEGAYQAMEILPDWIQARIKESETYKKLLEHSLPNVTADDFQDVTSDDIPF